MPLERPLWIASLVVRAQVLVRQLRHGVRRFSMREMARPVDDDATVVTGETVVEPLGSGRRIAVVRLR
jgi:hypothetical protein